uniref:FAM194 C-terminal domain-containing protein n=1 Tax=Tetraselmis chuii TaxID=63592 RepID=A0A6U1HT32_9CHLO|mmetsp:Transcript_2955/g.5299  ORF Transcript_2955/g.5299 Transcript_2955/m.5299 type:complete len:467 (+) Transcript_2955:133-1533(+)
MPSEQDGAAGGELLQRAADEDGVAEEVVDKIDATGNGVIWYPSGNIAVNVSIGDVASGGLPTRQAIFMSDKRKPVVLASFDHNGEGFVNYASGKPWLLVNRLKGYSVSDENGSVVEKGKWPRGDATPVMCRVTEAITVEFVDRQRITVTFSLLNVTRTFELGENLKRTDTYLDKSVGTSTVFGLRGKHDLDVGEIRRTLAETGSLYHRPGPHATSTKHSGVGMLRTLTKELPPESEAMEMINGMEDAMQRMKKVSLIKGHHAPAGGVEPFEDFGTPPMTESMQTLKKGNFARKAGLATWYNTAGSRYTAKRKKFPSLTLRKFYEVTDTAPPSGVLVVVCFHADWNPLCRKQQGQIEEVWGLLQAAAAKEAMCRDAHVHIYRLDASEAVAVQKKYDFRTVPMYFQFYNGKLVSASSSFSGKEKFLEQIRKGQEAGERGTFLPDNFTFGVRDNNSLDFINADMTLSPM